MPGWDLKITLETGSGLPVFRQVAEAIRKDISRGRLAPGDLLPGYRLLAESLGVNRNTILAAYQELLGEGWIVSRPSEGTFVAEAPPRWAPSAEPPGTPGPPPEAEPILSIGTGAADPRELPRLPLARAYARALNTPAALRALDPQGLPRLRELLAEMLTRLRGFPADPGRLMVTRGSRMGLYLVIQSLIRPGDRVAVESPGSPRAWEVLRERGAELVPVPVDHEGLQIDALEARLREGPLRMVLVTAACQYPTTVSLVESRQRRLLGLSLQHRFHLLEHDAGGEFHFGGPPALPLAAKDVSGGVIHVGTLSRLLAPGLRLGTIHAPQEVMASLRRVRSHIDGSGDPILELAIADLMEEGALARHVNRLERTFARRRDVLMEALHGLQGVALSIAPPRLGSALWIEAPGTDVDRWHTLARKAEVEFKPGRAFLPEGGALNCLRMGFTGHDERELKEAVQRMSLALSALHRGG
ncbi:MAG TPA: PLP-dependent aminotransferase family protein [Holophagaceae bacterium]|nr:PLP-dependent aminotransferase family protein [Holophagaceae bacterium]